MVQRILWLNYKEDEEEEKNERKREKKNEHKLQKKWSKQRQNDPLEGYLQIKLQRIPRYNV